MVGDAAGGAGGLPGGATVDRAGASPDSPGGVGIAAGYFTAGAAGGVAAPTPAGGGGGSPIATTSGTSTSEGSAGALSGTHSEPLQRGQWT